MGVGQFVEDFHTASCQTNVDLATVVRTWFADDQFLKPEPIDQSDSAVVRDLKLLSKFSDCCGVAPRKSLDRE